MMKESQHVEWKTSWRDEYLKWICGFANAEGGKLVIGMDDAGVPVGVDDAEGQLVELPNKIRDLLGMLVDVNLHNMDGREVIEILVPAYSSPINLRGRYYQRSGSTLQELKGAALDRFLLRKQGRTWDGVPIGGVTLKNLSSDAIKRFRALAGKSGRVEPGIQRSSTAELVDKLRLREAGDIKRAAVLVFHRDPEQFVSGAFVKIGFFRGDADLVYHDEVHGDLFYQVETTIELLQSKYLKAAIQYDGIQRVESFPVPLIALREVVVNAIVHRDYAVPAPVQIRVHDDHLSIFNPAILPEGWTLRKLLGEHASIPCNPIIANVFFRAGEIEAWGRGIALIHQACRESGIPKPNIQVADHELWVNFTFSRDYMRAMAGSASSLKTFRHDVVASVETSVEASVKTTDALLALMRQNPNVTLAEAAALIGRSVRAVEMASSKLVRDGRVRRVGSRKGGRWEVLG